MMLLSEGVDVGNGVQCPWGRLLRVPASCGPFGRKCPNQCPNRLAGLPDSHVQAAVARDEHGKVNFGCDGHAAVRHSVASAVPETAAGVSRLGAACPTGCADKPSSTVSYGGCGITS